MRPRPLSLLLVAMLALLPRSAQAQAPVAAAARKPEVGGRGGFFKSLMDKLF